MLKIEIPAQEGWDETNCVFTEPFSGCTLQLEHSLVSLSRWESIWHKPFLTSINTDDNIEEFKSYVQCMNMTQSFDPKCLDFLTKENYRQIKEYIENPMTATWFREDPKKHGKSGMGGPVLTSEYIYYLMIDCGIPKEMEKWHLNRLMTLIRIVKEKEKSSNKKQSQRDIMNNYAAMKARSRMPK